MKLTGKQREIVNYRKSCTVLGVPGSGKTLVMFRKIAALIENGVKPESIAVMAFSYRNMLVLKEKMRQSLGDAASGVVVGTTVDLPLKAMGLSHKQADLPRVADNNFMRRIMRQAMVEVGFTGHSKEAEHIIRGFKSRGRKPSEADEHYDLFRAYKQHLEQTGLVDRHDIIRKHIIGMRNDVYEPVPVKHIFVDNFQDITQIQMLWLTDHLKAGIQTYVFGCDDLTIFRRDGALGRSAFVDYEEMNNLNRFTLGESFRLPPKVATAAEKIVAPLKDRLMTGLKTKSQKDNKGESHEGGAFHLKSHNGVDAEISALTDNIETALNKNSKTTVGVVTRYDLQARQVERALQARGIEHSSFARAIWETPGAMLVLDLLGVFLNKTSKSRLRNVLSIFGISGQAVETLYEHGLSPDGWLKRGAPVPKSAEADLPGATLRDLGLLRQKLLNYARMMKPLGPKTVFKAMVLHMVENMRPENQQDALLALDELLSTKGNLNQVIAQLLEHRQPDPTARVVVTPVRESRNMEFTHVFVPFVTNTNYPYKYRVLPRQPQPERRLLFMAATRASQALTLSHCGGKPSEFLKQLE